jgi:hypothetical protein
VLSECYLAMHFFTRVRSSIRDLGRSLLLLLLFLGLAALKVWLSLRVLDRFRDSITAHVMRGSIDVTTLCKKLVYLYDDSKKIESLQRIVFPGRSAPQPVGDPLQQELLRGRPEGEPSRRTSSFSAMN